MVNIQYKKLIIFQLFQQCTLYSIINLTPKKYMRRRSGAIHCQTEEQLLELASNNQLGLYYNQGPRFKEMKFQNQWSISQAQDQSSQVKEAVDFDEEETEQKQQQKQLNKGKRYLQNCVVDKQIIRCSIQICIVSTKIEQTISKMVSKDSLLNLFIHAKDNAQNCIYKHSTLSSTPNSNVFTLSTKNIQCCTSQMEKQNFQMTPKNWLKNVKSDKMMQLLIVKKHICISQNSQIGCKRITIIHRIFIVNQKYIQNPLIKIYLQKSHFVVDMRGETLKVHNDPDNKPNRSSIYNKIFHHKSFFEKDCTIFNKGQFSTSSSIQGESLKFKHAFHKIEERIAKNYMRKLNEILLAQKLKPFNNTQQTK